ncbi:MAG: GTPase HflX [bacterium]
MNEQGIIVKVLIQEEKYNLEYDLEELTNLCNSCLIDVVDTMTQMISSFNKKTYIGSGKLLELKTLVDNNDISIVIFDDELSPTQLRNIEEVLEIKVIDRSMLILDIFRKRAKSNESILEVKLAQLKYLLPRLSSMNSDFSRQGGFQTKGPGEKQIDLDKRKILEEIYLIESKLANNRNTRMIQKQKRIHSNIPIVALVGYTNSGKSTTMNTLIKQTSNRDDKLVYEKDQLFATLDTSVRHIKLKNKFEFMLIDTVGFVSKLPHHLINSFHSTLSDTLDADLIIHVVDSSNTHYNKHISVTNDVIRSIGASNIKQLYLLNKCDKQCNIPFLLNEDHMLYSNKSLENFDKLISYITNTFKNTLYQDVELHIPYTESKLISYLEGYAITTYKLISNDFIYYKCSIKKDDIKQFNDYIVSNINP